MTDQHLKCSQCECEKLMDEFYHNKAQGTGFDNLCISCRKLRNEESHRDKVRARGPWVWSTATFEWVLAGARLTEGYAREHGIAFVRGPKPGQSPQGNDLANQES